MDFDHVVMDTDVASHTFKARRPLPPSITAALLGKPAVITFVTLGELTKWAIKRDWGPTYRDRLES